MVNMKWQYKVSLFFAVFSQVVFFALVGYHTDLNGYSYIWYHFEHWSISLILSIMALAFFVLGLREDLKILLKNRSIKFE